MSGSGREALAVCGNGREALPDVREWLSDPLGCPGVVGKLSGICGSGWEDHPDVRELSDALPDV